MILQAAMLVLVASALQSAAPEPTKPPVLPPGCDLTEEQVLALAIPDYERKLAESKAHADDRPNEFQFSAEVTSAILSDLGVGHEPLLLATVHFLDGPCSCCNHDTALVVEPTSPRVVWRYSPDDSRPSVYPYVVRVFRTFPTDRALTMALRGSTGDCAVRGPDTEEEVWLRPKMVAPNQLTFDTIWHGVVAGGNYSDYAAAQTVCATMESLWPRRAYRWVFHNLTGWETHRALLASMSDVNPNACGERGPHRTDAIDFTVTRNYQEDPRTGVLEEGETASIERRDVRPTTTFPFTLPVRRVVLDRSLLPPPSKNRMTSVQSPRGDLVASRTPRGMRNGVDIRRLSEGSKVREVPDPAWIDPTKSWETRQMEYAGLDVGPIGWTPDGSRCLVVVDFGLFELPPVLVSLTTDARGDRWEGFLPSGYCLADGFILDLDE
jgi:hypothetical protein